MKAVIMQRAGAIMRGHGGRAVDQPGKGIDGVIITGIMGRHSVGCARTCRRGDDGNSDQLRAPASGGPRPTTGR